MEQFIANNPSAIYVILAYLIGMWFSCLAFGYLFGKNLWIGDRMLMAVLWPIISVGVIAGLVTEFYSSLLSSMKNKFPKIFGFVYILSLPFRPSEIGVLLGKIKDKPKHKDELHISSVWIERKPNDEVPPEVIDMKTGKRIA